LPAGLKNWYIAASAPVPMVAGHCGDSVKSVTVPTPSVLALPVEKPTKQAAVALTGTGFRFP
jgi:hypothetical protein